MSLQILAKKRVGYRVASLIATFAFVAQPIYGLVASQAVNAKSGKIVSIVFENIPPSVDVDNSTKLEIRALDSKNGKEKLSPAGSLEVVSSSSTGRFAEFATSSFNSSNNATFTFKSGDSLKGFYYKDSTPGQHTITATLRGDKITA